MILSTLCRWLFLFVVTVAVSLLAATVLAKTIALCAARTEATRLLLQQRSCIDRMVDKVSTGHSTPPRLQAIGEQGIIQFKSRQAKLCRLDYLFDDELAVELNRMGGLAEEVVVGCEDDGDGSIDAELLVVGHAYLRAADKLLTQLATDNDSASSLETLSPAIVLVTVAWITAIFTFYYAVFKLSYGYDLFMRNYMEI